MPVFKKIARTFFFGPFTDLNEFSGAVIAEARGFYLVFDRTQVGRSLLRMNEIYAEVFGKPPVVLCDGISENNDKVIECDLADLPAEITDHSDWPVKLSEGRTILIPKRVIDRVSYSIWKGVTVIVGEAQYHFAVGLFQGRSVTRFLRDAGWDV